MHDWFLFGGCEVVKINDDMRVCKRLSIYLSMCLKSMCVIIIISMWYRKDYPSVRLYVLEEIMCIWN